MKHIAKSMVLIGAMVAAGSASANIIDDICPYLGLDYKQLWIKGKGAWNNRVAKSFPGGTFYLGTKLTDCFGIELGYSWTTRKHKTTTIQNNTFFPAANGAVIRTHARFNSFHVDLNGYVPLDNCWELIGSIGVASMKPKLNVSVTTPAGLNTNQIAFLQSANGKSKAVWRIGAGAQYLFTECVGIRAIVRWEATESLRVHHTFNNFGDKNRKAFKDSVSLAGGVFVRF